MRPVNSDGKSFSEYMASKAALADISDKAASTWLDAARIRVRQ